MRICFENMLQVVTTQVIQALFCFFENREPQRICFSLYLSSLEHFNQGALTLRRNDTIVPQPGFTRNVSWASVVRGRGATVQENWEIPKTPHSSNQLSEYTEVTHFVICYQRLPWTIDSSSCGTCS